MKKASFNSKGSIKLTKRNVPDVSHITSKHSGKAKLSSTGTVNLKTPKKAASKKERPTWKTASKPKMTSTTARTSTPKASFKSTGSVNLKQRTVPNVSNIVKNVPNVSGIVKNHSGKAKLSNTGVPQLKNPYRRKRKARFNDSSKLNLPNRIAPNVSNIVNNHSGKAKLSSTGTVNLPERTVPDVSNIVKGPRSKRKRQEAKAMQIAKATGMSFQEALAAVRNKKKKVVTAAKPKSPWIDKARITEAYTDEVIETIKDKILDMPTVNEVELERLIDNLDNMNYRTLTFIDNMFFKNQGFVDYIDPKVLDEVHTLLHTASPEKIDEIYRWLISENVEEKYQTTDPSDMDFDEDYGEMQSLLLGMMERLGINISNIR